jgi:ERCC4-type nuclease
LVYLLNEQIEQMKKGYAEDFAIITDDGSFYKGIAIGLLDSLKTKMTSATKLFVQCIDSNKR